MTTTIKCWISNVSLKCWGKVIQTLASVGESDIHFTITPNLLTLYTYDSSHSVCCTCKFDKTFFCRYDVREDTQLFCRIPSKCMLKPFKSLRFLQRCSDTCEIEFDPDANTLAITVPCRGGVKVRHKLNFSVDSDSEELDFDPQALNSCISAEPKLFLRSLSNFIHSKGVAELTLKVLNNKLLLKNCVNDMIKKEGKVYTELMMNSVDFSHYAIESENELSFPMREFKTFVSFAEHVKTSLTLNFNGPNEPLLVTAQSDDGLYCATLLLATRSSGQHDRSGRTNKRSNAVIVTPRIRKETSVSSNPSLHDRTTSTSASTSSYFDVHTSAWTPSPLPVTPVAHSSGKQPISNPTALKPPESCPPLSQNSRIAVPPMPVFDNEPCDMDENDQNLAPDQYLSLHLDNCPDDTREELGRKRMRMLFPNLGRPFDPKKDIPGYNDILVECSDDEDS